MIEDIEQEPSRPRQDRIVSLRLRLLALPMALNYPQFLLKSTNMKLAVMSLILSDEKKRECTLRGASRSRCIGCHLVA